MFLKQFLVELSEQAVRFEDQCILALLKPFPIFAHQAFHQHGDQRGRGIGFPTANLDYAREKVIPAGGIYACWAFLGEERHMAAVNVGTNPTFTPDKQTLSVEAYLLDFDRDLYGEVMRLEFVARLRDEMRYASVEALIEQISLDVEQTRNLLGTA